MPILELYMARLVVKNTHQKDSYYDEIELGTQNKNTILRFLTHETTIAKRDLQLLSRLDNLQSHPLAKCVCGVKSVH